jgi:hypothetical protein
MRVDTRPRKRNAPRIAEKSAPGFLQWLRGRECACCYPDSGGRRIEASHVDHGGDKGMGTKTSDRFAIPLCGGPDGHHAEQHRIGWRSFETKYQFDAVKAAMAYWHLWPGRIAWERKLEEGR